MKNREYESIMLAVMRAYLAMAEGLTNNGCEDNITNPHRLNPRAGLCHAIDVYSQRMYPMQQFDVAGVLHSMLLSQIYHQFLDVDTPHYPFGEADYYQRVKDRTQHECPERLAFVKQYIEYLEA